MVIFTNLFVGRKNYPRNINNMPAVIFSVRLDLVEIRAFLYLR